MASLVAVCIGLFLINQLSHLLDLNIQIQERISDVVYSVISRLLYIKTLFNTFLFATVSIPANVMQFLNRLRWCVTCDGVCLNSIDKQGEFIFDVHKKGFQLLWGGGEMSTLLGCIINSIHNCLDPTMSLKHFNMILC